MNPYIKLLETHIHPNKQLILQHPFVQTLAQGELTKPQLQAFGIQYYYLYSSIPRLTAAIMTGLTNATTRYPFVEYLWKEHGSGNLRVSYDRLFENFLTSAGVDIETNTELPYATTIQYNDKLTELCINERVPIGLGAFVIGIVHWFPEEFQLILSALHQYDYLTSHSFAFWKTRQDLMQEYYPLFVKVVESWVNTEESKNLLIYGARRAMELKFEFWEGLARYSSPKDTFFAD